MTLAVYSAARQLGVISLAGGRLTGTTPGLQGIADVAVARAGGNATRAYAALDGWTNGYLTVITDPAEQDAAALAGGPAAAFAEDEHPRGKDGRFARKPGRAEALRHLARPDERGALAVLPPVPPSSVVTVSGPLTEGERMCRDGYMSRDGSELYQRMLRDGTARPYEFGPGGNIWDLDHAIGKYRLRGPATAYRGIADTGGRLKVGATIHDDGYTSVSEDRKVADWFARLRVEGSEAEWAAPLGGVPVVVALRLPAGAHAMPGDISVKEYVLPRGGSYHVAGELPDGTLVADWAEAPAPVPVAAAAVPARPGPVDLASLPRDRGLVERMAGATHEITVTRGTAVAAFREDEARDYRGRWTGHGDVMRPDSIVPPEVGKLLDHWADMQRGGSFTMSKEEHRAVAQAVRRYGGEDTPRLLVRGEHDAPASRYAVGKTLTLSPASFVADEEHALPYAEGGNANPTLLHLDLGDHLLPSLFIGNRIAGHGFGDQEYILVGRFRVTGQHIDAEGIRNVTITPARRVAAGAADGHLGAAQGDVDAGWREALHHRKSRGQPGGGEFTRDGGGAPAPKLPEPPRGPGTITVLNDGTTTDPATSQPRAYLADPAVRAAAIAEVQHGLTEQHKYIPSVTGHLAVRLGDPLGQSGTKTLGVTIVEQKGRPPAPRTLEEILEQAETEQAGGEGKYAEGIRLAPWITRAAAGDKPDQSLAKAQARGWWVPSDPEWNLTDTTVAHETGHVAAAQVPGPVMSSMAVWGPVAKAAGLPPPQVFSGFGKPPEEQVVSPGKWLADNRAAIAGAVSEYGSKSVGELEAELWSEYTTRRTPRGAAKAYGDFLRGYLEAHP